VTALATLARLFGVDRVATSATGVAQKKEVEIMMVLNQSGSMRDGTKMSDLKNAARSFVGYFQDTQDEDRMGLVSFATTVRVDFPLGNTYVMPMTNCINAMTANGWTNTEDAIRQAGGPSGFTNQAGLSGDQRVQQFMIFFSDGMPTAFRDRFKYDNQDYDGVVAGGSSNGRLDCRPDRNPVSNLDSMLYRPTGDGSYPNVNPDTTGDGRSASILTPPLTSCGAPNNRYYNTKWYTFETVPVPGYGSEQCRIPMNRLMPYFCDMARQSALDNAQALKDRGIQIYCIGLGRERVTLDGDFLRAISSGSGYTYITPNSSQLEEIFQQVAMQIKLRLVQ
jgi:hypothetical protein